MGTDRGDGSAARGALSAITIVVAAATLLMAVTLAFGRARLLDRTSFSARALTALDRAPVQAEIASRISAEIGVTDRQDAAIVSRAVTGVVADARFRPIFQEGVERMHSAILSGASGSVVIQLDAAADLVEQRVRAISPDLATATSGRLRSLAVNLGALASADAVRTLDAWKSASFVAGPVAILLLLAGILFARRRAIAAMWAGFAIALVGALVVALVPVGRAVVGANAGSALRPSARAVWDVFTDGLGVWGAIATAIGAIVVAAAGVAARGGARRARRTVGEMRRGRTSY